MVGPLVDPIVIMSTLVTIPQQMVTRILLTFPVLPRSKVIIGLCLAGNL